MASSAAPTSPDAGEFPEQRIGKRTNSSEEAGSSSAKNQGWTKRSERAEVARPLVIPTRNFFAPLRTYGPDSEPLTQQQPNPVPKERGRSPPIILTASINELKALLKSTLEFRSIRDGIKVVTKDMADYSALMRQLDAHEVPYYTLQPKSLKPVKAVIRQLPGDTPAEDISNELVAMGYSVISVRQMTTSRPQPQGGLQTINIPLFLVTITRNEKAMEIFKLTNLNHVIIKVEAYRNQGGLTRCHNCQNFGHVWATCRQPARCMWCGQRASTAKTPSGRASSSRYTTPALSFQAAVPGDSQPQQDQLGTTDGMRELAAVRQQSVQLQAQSVVTPCTGDSPLDMLRVATIVQQIVTEVNGAESEEVKIVAITQLVINLMNLNGH
jgi:hypothetical protein